MARSDEEKTGPGGGPFDWDGFQNSFFGGNGWKEALHGNPGGPIPWVDRYVKGILADAVPGPSDNGRTAQPTAESRQSSLACNVFETHRALIVRIRLSADMEPRQLRLAAMPHELRLAGLPGGEEKTVRLAVPVRVDGAKAVYKQNVIEVTLPREEAVVAKEIPIRFMEGG
ncbi:hypothetical protein ACFFNY_26120 [Paenibacillus hodogayensis]|uniref:Uncharacterized protein n=1 Tax=Paenibacillus hodogayensis TaxID=279208 RepID=A0ABV5W3B9_9BACL